MKWNCHGFSQRNLVKLGLDNDDAFILKWFLDFMAVGKMKPQINPTDGKIYYWVNYQGILNDLPAIRPSGRDAIGKRFRERYVAAGLLFHWTKKDSEGTYSYYAPNPEILDALLYDRFREAESDGLKSKSSPPPIQSESGTAPPSESGLPSNNPNTILHTDIIDPKIKSETGQPAPRTVFLKDFELIYFDLYKLKPDWTGPLGGKNGKLVEHILKLSDGDLNKVREKMKILKSKTLRDRATGKDFHVFTYAKLVGLWSELLPSATPQEPHWLKESVEEFRRITQQDVQITPALIHAAIHAMHELGSEMPQRVQRAIVNYANYEKHQEARNKRGVYLWNLAGVLAEASVTWYEKSAIIGNRSTGPTAGNIPEITYSTTREQFKAMNISSYNREAVCQKYGMKYESWKTQPAMNFEMTVYKTGFGNAIATERNHYPEITGESDINKLLKFDWLSRGEASLRACVVPSRLRQYLSVEPSGLRHILIELIGQAKVKANS